LLVVGIHEGAAPGPRVRNVNTAGMILERIGTLDDGLPVAMTRPQEVAEFVLGALREAELEGEEGTGKTNTAVFWLVSLKPNGTPSGSPVRRWTYRAIGRPDARISYDGHAVPTREEREAFKEHARRYR
jgi:hypothetical protein